MRLKDIFWPWGVIKGLEQDVAILEDRVKAGKAALMGSIESSLANIEYGARQRDIAANLRSECLRLHDEVEKLNDVLGHISLVTARSNSKEGFYEHQTQKAYYERYMEMAQG